MSTLNRDERRSISTRGLQAYGAACLVKFCAAKDISSPHVDELIGHLLSLLVGVDLPAWEAAGARLMLAGRGDPLPEQLSTRLPQDRIRSFQELVECVVEIGLVDMYGDDSGGPAEFVGRVIAILEAGGIRAPSIVELQDLLEHREGGWGLPESQDSYKRIRDWCLSQSGGSTQP
jgi:hypothetical protein